MLVSLGFEAFLVGSEEITEDDAADPGRTGKACVVRGPDGMGICDVVGLTGTFDLD